MTVIAAIGCNDGVIIAADSAASDSEAGSKQLCDKIRRIGTQPILYGVSGDVGLMQKISYNLEIMKNFDSSTPLKKIRKELRIAVIPELKEAINLHVSYPQQGFQHPPCAIVLFIGVHNRTPWILEIERNGNDQCYDKNFGYFDAIGSGKPWAQAIFRPHLYNDRDLSTGKVQAFRVIDDSINIASAYLARPIRIHTIDLDGNVKEVDETEMKVLEETCGVWRQIENESLGDALANKNGMQPKADNITSQAEIPVPPSTISN